MAVKKRRRISAISFLHYIKLCFRSILFLSVLILYIASRVNGTVSRFDDYKHNAIILGCICIIFSIEMLLRFFPSRLESMGCQKQFARNYIEREGCGKKDLKKGSWKVTLPVAASWFVLNGIIGTLYLTGIIDWIVMVLISLFYSVCDMICILFFCPFQTWFMKNKCCGSCRIYNWDFAMMFTPCLFLDNLAARWLLVLSLVLLLKWELTFHLHPERFYEASNCSLSCSNCKEKLCHHKKQLQSFLKKYPYLKQVYGRSNSTAIPDRR